MQVLGALLARFRPRVLRGGGGGGGGGGRGFTCARAVCQLGAFYSCLL